MYLFQHFFPSLITAALVCAAVFLPGLWVARWRDLGPALGLTAGYLGGHVVAAGWPPFPAREAAQWLPWFALIAAILGLADRKFRLPLPARSTGWLLLCAALIALLLKPGFQYQWSAGGGSVRVGAVVLAMLLISVALDRAASAGESAFSLILILFIAAAGTAVTLMVSGSAFLGQLAAVFAAATGGLLACSLVMKPANLHALNPVATVLLSSLIVSGGFYADLPLASALLLVLGLMTSTVPFRSGIRRSTSILIRAVVACVASALSVVMALRASPPFPSL